jgi:hypothetical protein
LIVPGDIEDGHIDLTLEKDDLLAINGALNWIANGIQSEPLRRDFKPLIGMDRTDCNALLGRIHALLPDVRPATTQLTQTEILAIELTLAMTADGPFSEDVHTLTGVHEGRYRRTIKALHAILQTWIGGTLKAGQPTGDQPIFHESQILPLARSVAASKRDAMPTLIQHSTSTRELANHVMTSGAHVVPGAETSHLIAIRGNFSGPTRRPPSLAALPEEIVTWSVQMLVVNAATGQVTDSGGSNDHPDLVALGPVTTDYATAPPDQNQLPTLLVRN